MSSGVFYVYILTNQRNTVLYIGVTNSLIKRIDQHRNKIFGGFTKKYNLDKLIYYEIIYGAIEAIAREKQLKHWNREWKINLIKKVNPEFKDLYPEILNT